MPSYDLLQDYSVAGGVISMSPGWVLAIARYKNQVTYNRKNLTKKRSGSYSSQHKDAVAERGMLIVSGDCTNLTMQGQKGAHSTELTATLLPSLDYRAEILPGDWVCAWIVTNEVDRRRLIRRLRDGLACNDFMDGFKFLGRVSGVRKQTAAQPAGIKTVGYTMNARGFSEFDSPILYFPQLEQKEKEAQSWLHKLGTYINKITRGGDIDVNLILPELIKVLLGEGIPRQRGQQRSPNQALPFLIPNSIATILGKKTKGKTAYADILEGIIGIQHYPNTNTHDHKPFLPAVRDENGGPLYATTKKMLGKFLPFPPSLDNRPIWGVLSDYLNPAINEMYVTLRANRAGQIVPHFIARQMPFTTPANRAGKAGTVFHELPRWKLHDAMVTGADIGTSDTTRFNLVQVVGVTPASPIDAAKTFNYAPPIWDDEDIKRSGLRPYITTVNTSRGDAVFGAAAWAGHVADFLMGQQLTYNGQFTCVGIQAPICIGDNLEYEGVVYHIEGVGHRCNITPDGMRQFWTTLQVTHGMSTEDVMTKARELATDVAQYPVLVAGTSGFLPGVTTEEK